MRAHQTLRDLPHVPASPQQRYAMAEPTFNHCDILRITAQLGVLGRFNPQEFHLGQEVFNLGHSCHSASSTANFIQDLIETKQVEVHFFERIKELLHQKFNVQCQVAQLHLEQRGTQFHVMTQSLDSDSARVFPSGFPLYLCKKFNPHLLAPRSLPCFGTLLTIDINLTINFTGWNNLPRLADNWSEEQQAPQHFVSRETHRIQQQVRSPPPPRKVEAWFVCLFVITRPAGTRTRFPPDTALLPGLGQNPPRGPIKPRVTDCRYPHHSAHGTISPCDLPDSRPV
jgi:hypothetical protein